MAMLEEPRAGVKELELELQELQEWDKARPAKVGSSIWKPPDLTSASLHKFLLGLRV